MIKTAVAFLSVEQTTVPLRLEDSGMKKTTAVRGGAPQGILVSLGRDTAWMTVTVKTLAGQCVGRVSVLKQNIFHMMFI